MPTETGTIDLKAQKAAHDNAAKTATNYITDITNSGIWVTPEDAKPVNGAAAATTSGWHIADALELFRAGASVFRVWTESAVAKVRIGGEHLPHILLANNTFKMVQSFDNGAGGYVDYDAVVIDSDGVTVNPDYGDVQSGEPHGPTRVSAERIAIGDALSGGQLTIGSLSGNHLSLGFDGSAYSATWLTAGSANLLGYDSDSDLLTVGGNVPVSVNDHDVLFSGSYSTTYNSAITGLPDLTDYARLLVEYEDSTGRKGSVWVDSPDGSTFSMQTVGGNSSAGMVTRFKTAVASGTTIDTQKDSYNRYTYGKVTVSPSGGVTYANAQEIGIVRVLGFR